MAMHTGGIFDLMPKRTCAPCPKIGRTQAKNPAYSPDCRPAPWPIIATVPLMARPFAAPFHDDRGTLINYRGEYACFFSSVI